MFMVHVLLNHLRSDGSDVSYFMKMVVVVSASQLFIHFVVIYRIAINVALVFD